MKVHSDILTSIDLYSAGNGITYVDSLVPVGSKSRARGFIVYLGTSDESRPWGNGAVGTRRSPSWDEYGLWMNRLFKMDESAIVGVYNGYEDFQEKTRAVRDRVAQWHDSKTLYARTHRAPWLS